MKATGAKLARFALEQIGTKFIMGIPGVHTTELYDELNMSEQITPILVTHELGAAFIADGISRTSSTIGTLLIVPAAGTTHASSGIAEAFLDGIPLLVISGGIRRDTGRSYQLHDIDQEKLTSGFVKKYFRVKNHQSIIETIYDAFDLATSGEPGPVFVEIPADLQLFEGEVEKLTPYLERQNRFSDSHPETTKIKNACDIIKNAKKIGIYAGWGAKEATLELKELAELLHAPVSTTLQGLSVFPFEHGLHTGMGFGIASVPASQNAFKDMDCLIAVGARFSELGTGSYGINVPENLIHIDINPEVFNKNFNAKVSLCGDAKKVLTELILKIKFETLAIVDRKETLKKQIQNDKRAYFASWKNLPDKGLVNPYLFLNTLHMMTPQDSFVVADDGNHTFLTAELLPIHLSKHFVCPTDFNAMGYAVPCSIGVKLANPDHHVTCIVGDGGLLMTGLEILTAKNNNLGILYCVFNDGELGMISSFQKIPLNRKTCSIINNLKVEGIALATGAQYIKLSQNKDIENTLSQCMDTLKQKQPVILDISIDYSNKTQFSKGVVKTNLSRFSLGEKIRFIGRAIKRHTLG